MKYEQAKARSDAIKVAATVLNQLIYAAETDGIDVDVEVKQTQRVRGRPVQTVRTNARFPLDTGAR